MSMRKHIVRAGVLSLLGAALAFAYPTDGRTGGATAEFASVQASTVAHEEEMRHEKLMHKASRVAIRPAARREGELFEGVRVEP